VWGPFHDVLGTGAWVSEGGISASGKVIDFLLESHPAYAEAQRMGLHGERGPGQHVPGTGHVQQYLHKHLASMASAQGLPSLALLTAHLHVGPDFAGNRSPIGDPALTGSVIGLDLDAASLDALALLYLATLQALALGTQHILEALHAAGHPRRISHLCVSGGLGLKNDLFCQVHADVTRCTMVLPPARTEGVLLGSAMLAATAAGRYASVQEAMQGMIKKTGKRRLVLPCEDPRVQAFYAGKRNVFHAMREDQVRYRAIMKEAMGEGRGTGGGV
jgi:ribulose kinase